MKTNLEIVEQLLVCILASTDEHHRQSVQKHVTYHRKL